jgi:hypothetical protein
LLRNAFAGLAEGNLKPFETLFDPDAKVKVFKVFTFRAGESVVVRMNDCIDESYVLQDVDWIPAGAGACGWSRGGSNP